MTYLIVKWLHIVSSTLLFGTGIGTAFYLLAVTLSRDVHTIASVTRYVVRADWLFTAPTVVLQPLTGLWLVHMLGMPLATPWLAWSLVLYGIAIACWLPVVWLQIRMRDSAALADHGGTSLPDAYWRDFRAWFVLGFPALGSFLGIFYLMVFRPG